MKNLFILLVFCCTQFSTLFGLEKKEELTKEVLCAGCEATVREISKHLSYNTAENLEKIVPKVLSSICNKDNFMNSDLKPESCAEACKQLLKKRKTDITKVLVEYYSKKKQSKSYLELSRKVCENTGICEKKREDGKPTEGGIVFNDETQEFEVLMGDNVRMPHPIINEEKVVSKKQKKVSDPVPTTDTVKPLKPVIKSHDEL